MGNEEIIEKEDSTYNNNKMIIPETIKTSQSQEINSKNTFQTSTSADSSISSINSEEDDNTNELSPSGGEDHTLVSFGSGSLCNTTTVNTSINTSSQTTLSSSSSPKQPINELFNEIESLNWENVLQRLKKYPNEAQCWEKIRVRKTSSWIKTERLPIHHACLKLRMEIHSKKLAIKVINELIDLYPDGCGMRESRHGCLPLHLLAYASSCVKCELTKCLRDKCVGKSLMVGLLPDLEHEEDLDVEEELVRLVKKMIKVYPRAPEIDSEGGRLPLHMACSGKACPGVFQVLLSAYPSASRHRTRDLNLPLHLTASWGISSADVPISLLQAYPDAALGQNRYGRTPLEEAIFIAGDIGRENQMDLLRVIRKHPTFWLSPQGRKVTSFEHFLQIIKEFNEADKTKSPTPKIYELIKLQEWDGVLDRLDDCPEEVQFFISISSRAGRSIRYTPLHYACEFDPPLHVIQTMAALYPTALSRRSIPGGFLPLHLASTYSKPNTISYIFERFPRAIGAKDELGNLPLHLLCYSPQSTDVIVHQLLSHSPNSIFATNKAGSTPLDIVSRLHPKNKTQVIASLNKFIFFYNPTDNDNEIEKKDNERNLNTIASSSSKKELVWI